MKKLVSFICALMAVAFTAQAKDFRLSSPSGDIKVKVNVGSRIFWSAEYKGEQILSDSQISMTLSDGTILGEGYLRPKAFKHSENNVLTDLVPTKNRQIEDRFNELKLRFGKDWALVFRAYDNGLAYRFETYFDGSIEVASEVSEWNFTSDNEVYWVGEKNPDYITHCEANFQQMPLSKVGQDTYSYLPLSFKTPSHTRVVITEADLFDYPNLFLRSSARTSLSAEFPHVIDKYAMRTDRDVTITELSDVIARTRGTRTFPWRVLLTGSDKDLLENTLPWQLSSREVPGDYSWLRPGKISWEWWAALNVYGVDFEAGVNTDTYKYYVDFAARYGLPYILMDEGWSKSTLNIVEPKESLDLQEIISYGASKGVGVVLWALWTPFAQQGVEEILDVYQKWGVAGIKVDFMQMQDQNMVNLYEKIAAEACERHILVDFHGAFKPSGLQRKYPNAMTFEGVYGMEHDKCSYDISPDHDLKLPFTRMVAGPMDYTPGAVNNATRDDFAIRWNHPMSQGTRSHQAALFVVFESPLTMLCDSPSNYYKVPDYTEFIAAIPTVWEKTICQEASAGDYVVLSRQTADGRWYSAALNNWTERVLTLDTSFLEKGDWQVTIHRDGVNANVWAEDYVIEKKTIRSGDVLEINLANGGGWVAEFKR